MPATPAELEPRLWRPVADLVAAAGLGREWTMAPLPGGGNNRAFRIEAKTSTVFLKVYFHHEADPRDRLGAEFDFAAFAWRHGIRCVPEPLRCDREHRLALYAFIDGRGFSPGEVTREAVERALAFFDGVNRHRCLDDAKTLPPASEACFSLDDHLEQVERRVTRLLNLPEAGDAVEGEASAFVRTALAPAWRRIADGARDGAAAPELPPAVDRCLSPSDFGFHNALAGRDGSIYFIDFEYAGWDDPAKTVCDFFWQQAVPVPLEFYDLVLRTVASMFPVPETYGRRVALLFPVYGIKWCCIALNDFLPVGRARRSFAGRTGDRERKVEQLETARRILRDVGERSG